LREQFKIKADRMVFALIVTFMSKQITQCRVEGVKTTLSFKPLIRTWEKIAGEGPEGVREIYANMLENIRKFPELTGPIENLEILEKHQPLLSQIMSTIFPITLSDKDDLYAVMMPFSFQPIYGSELFKTIFRQDSKGLIESPPKEVEERIIAKMKVGMYQLILSKIYGSHLSGQITSIYPYTCPITHLEKYVELQLDTRFIDVIPKTELPELPEDCQRTLHQVNDMLKNPKQMDWLPLELFSFEGFSIMQIREVTEREVINNIKNHLLTLQSFADVETFKKLQDQIQNLIRVPGVQIGITPFLEINGRQVFSDLHNASSIFLKNLTTTEEKLKVSSSLQRLFADNTDIVVIPEITDESSLKYSFLQPVRQQGWAGIIICPLFSNNKLIGILEILTETPGQLDHSVILRIEPAIPLFELALQKSADNLEAQVDKIIKEQFTAVQSSVEWRFTDAAISFLTTSQQDEDNKIETIVFDNVYPLYAAIDVRNSSTERNRAIQQDLLEQLEMAESIIKKARRMSKYPLLKEIGYKIDKYKHSVTNIVLSDDEIAINHFLKDEIVQLFEHLRTAVPSLHEEITKYFVAVTSVVDMLYHHRKHFDESITFINNSLAKFIDREQQIAQKIFPHYFERFVTDGLDFNIYIGQSISPSIPFNKFYLKNLKIWQLTTLAKAAQLTHALESKLQIPLQTTQLILSNSNPISISFRPAERKFDVDGAYNIRYEIIKKRIDKVRIKDTNDRLTQPGTIAIVYSQPQEAAEYLEYIEFLQSEGLLRGEPERFDLEELQGVSGLKALRVAIDYPESPQTVKSEEKKLREPAK
jgi:hypothetical protein